jgi:uncharacterized membrane protein (UPF0127 family)
MTAIVFAAAVLVFGGTAAAPFCGYPIAGDIGFEREGAVTCRFEVGLAETPKDWQQGLMRCKGLPRGNGLLFLFEDARLRSFWMKNTPLPLAIVFIDSGGRVVSIEKGEPFSTRSIPSGSPAAWVLEIHQSEADCLAVGDLARFTRY